MESKIVTIHQAFYGEANKAHSKLKQTINDPDLTSFLLTFTDRPGSLPPGVELKPYLSGAPFSRYYVFTKTFADTSAIRAGMVFTHVLILNLSDIIAINDLHDILSLFVQSIKDKNQELTELQKNVFDRIQKPAETAQPKFIQETISALINGVHPILFSGDIVTFSKALQQIWNSPNAESRKKIKFRTSLSPSDIENAKDLTIVSIQKEFLSKWQGQKIIQGENQDIIKIVSHSEALFLGSKTDNPFYNFIIELNADIGDIHKYGLYEKLYSNYRLIEEIEDANVLRQDIRVLSKICPSPPDSKEIKERFIGRLSKLIVENKDTNIKALRNIDWEAFDGGTKKPEEIVFKFISNQLENGSQRQLAPVSETIILAVEETPKNWWHSVVTAALNSAFKNQSSAIINNIWNLMDFSESTLKNVLSVISLNLGCDTILRKHIPEKLKPETCKAFIPVARENSWYLLHADILLKYLSVEQSIEIQLEIERGLPMATSYGLRYIVALLSNEKLIDLAIQLKDVKLIEFAAERIDKEISLLNKLDFSIDGWLEMWTAFVLKTRKVFMGLSGREQIVVFSLLDLLIKGKAVNTIVLNLITNTPYLDLCEYGSRPNIWKVLPIPEKGKFLISTSNSVLTKLLSGKIDPGLVEPEIVGIITSDNFMTNFLYEYRANLKPVLKIYESFVNLRDNFLSDYIQRYSGNISEEQSKALGWLVMKRNYSITARTLYDKAKYYSSFSPAYEECKNIVTLNWWQSLGLGKAPIKHYSSSSEIASYFMSEKQISREQLPTVVILTAIHEEYAAVRLHLKDIVEVIENDTSYEAGIFEFNGREIAKVIIRECGSRNAVASLETERAIQYFKPGLMLFVGIAGSRKPNDFSIGDVIFPEKIYSYEGGKAEKDTFLSRPDLISASFALSEIAKRERRKTDWKSLVKKTWHQEFKADLGIIASGEQLIEHYDSTIGKIIKEHYNDTSAVEMEGFGFAKAAYKQGRETSNLLIGVVRGISDIIEQPSANKKKETNYDRRPAYAKLMASDTAAAFAYWLIVKVFQ